MTLQIVTLLDSLRPCRTAWQRQFFSFIRTPAEPILTILRRAKDLNLKLEWLNIDLEGEGELAAIWQGHRKD